MVEPQFEDTPCRGGRKPGRSDGRIGGRGNYGRICGGGTASGTCGCKATIGPGSQDVVQIHVGEDDL